MNRNARKLTKLAVVLAVACAALIGCRSQQENLNRAPAQSTPAAPSTPVDSRFTKEAQLVEPGTKSTFDHFRDGHKELTDCADCHKRDAASAADPRIKQPNRPAWLPYHDACIRCHTADREPYNQTGEGVVARYPFCGACHQDPIVTVTADQAPQAKLLNYPNSLDQFGLKGGTPGFSHRTHMDAGKMGEDANLARCDTCHRFDGGGVRSSFPKHQQCFSCHAHQAGGKFADCGTCHIDRQTAVQYTAGAGSARQFNFRHSPSHLRSSCDRCHRSTEPASPRQADILRIRTGRGQRHSSACWSCHQQARETVCSKCHSGGIPF